jgi:hypothetical protein
VDQSALFGTAKKVPYFSFNAVGDTIQGLVTAARVSQETDFDSGEKRFWENGKPVKASEVKWPQNAEPILQLVVDLVLNDGTESRVYYKGELLKSLRDALREVGAAEVEVGAQVATKFTEEIPNSRGRGKPKKLFKSVYVAPQES